MKRGILALTLLLVPGIARADIFKFVKKDGTVVYTDKLVDLPEERRAYYNQKIAERERAQAEVERQVGKEELERRQAEVARAEAERQARDDRDRAERVAAIDVRLLELRRRAAERENLKKQWQARIRDARKKLEQALENFHITQERFNEIGMRADFTLLPGQADERDNLAGQLQSLEKQIDALIFEIDEKIPDEARRAGVPPGWLRE